MPRVHFVKKSRKEYPGLPVGSSYYWWKFRYAPKRRSATKPRRSQLTQSGFLATLYELEDNPPTDLDGIESLIDELTDLASECQDSLDNMPEQLQDTSESGELLSERISNLEQWSQSLQELIDDEDETLTPEGLADAISECNPGIN